MRKLTLAQLIVAKRALDAAPADMWSKSDWVSVDTLSDKLTEGIKHASIHSQNKRRRREHDKTVANVG